MTKSVTIPFAIDRFWEIIPSTWHTTRHTIRRVAVEQFEMSVAQFQILRRIRNGYDEVSSLADAWQSSRSSVSKVVDVLVNKGLVVRKTDKQDRRHIHLALTDEGVRLLNGIYDETERWLGSKFQSLTPDELAIVVDALEVLGKVFDLLPAKK
jgi:DNA-binding MarR family transcriptional regulator